jgi:hypothetical protein
MDVIPPLPSVFLQYVMAIKHLSAAEATEAVQAKRGQSKPSPGE